MSDMTTAKVILYVSVVRHGSNIACCLRWWVISVLVEDAKVIKVTLIEETTKVVKPSRVVIDMHESDAHKLLEQLGDYDIPDNAGIRSPLYMLWHLLNQEIGQR